MVGRARFYQWLLRCAVGAVLLWGMPGRGVAGSDPLDEYAARFTPTQPALHIEYRVAYRFLALELRNLAQATLNFTGGTWSNRVTGTTMPAALMDLRVDSPDKAPQRSRASVHVRLVSLITLPDLQALFYGKETWEYFNPVFGRSSANHDIAIYDMESGNLHFWKTNCLSGEVTSELTNAVAMAEQSRQVLPTLTALMDAYREKRPMLTPQDQFAVQVSIDDRVVPLMITTRRDEAPVSVDGKAPAAMIVAVSPGKNSKIRARPFKAWVTPYRNAAALSGDTALQDMAARAAPEGLIPLALDYGLALGSVRCTLTGMKAATNAPASEKSSTAEPGKLPN